MVECGSVMRSAILRVLASACAIVWCAILSTAQAQQVLHVANKIEPAIHLLDIDNQLRWKFGAGEKALDLASTEIVRWGAWTGITRNSAVWLNDGSWIVGDLQTIAPEQIVVRSDWFEELAIPMRSVRGIVNMAAASLSGWNRMQRQMESAAGARDNVWLAGGRQVSGIIRLDAPNTTPMESFGIENAGQATRVEWKDTQAITFSPALLGPLPAQSNHLVLGLTDGSRLNVRSLALDESRLRLSLFGGLELRTLDQRSEFIVGVNLIANRPDNVTFLGDLEPASYRNISHSRIPWSLGKNRDQLNRPLMNEVGIVARGLSMHSSSQAAYRWDGSEARLLAEVRLAAPPESNFSDLANVNYQVLVARGGKLEAVVEMKLDRRSTDSKFIDVDLTNAQLVALVTEQGEFGPYGDHLLWLDARIAK